MNRLAEALEAQLVPYGWHRHPRVNDQAPWVWWRDGSNPHRELGCSPSTVMYYDREVTLLLVTADPADVEAIVATLYVWRVIPRPAGRMVSGGW